MREKNYSRVVEEILSVHRVEIAADTLVGHGGIENLLAFGLIAAPYAVMQHVRARL